MSPAAEAASRILLNPMSFLMIGGLAWMLFMVIRAATARDPPDIALGGHRIPVKATFAGISGLPAWFAIAINNARPLLVLQPGGITYRVLRRHDRPYADIAEVDVRTGPGTVNLILRFHGEPLTFAANVGTVAAARAVLALFPPNTPLSPRAAVLLDHAPSPRT